MYLCRRTFRLFFSHVHTCGRCNFLCSFLSSSSFNLSTHNNRQASEQLHLFTFFVLSDELELLLLTDQHSTLSLSFSFSLYSMHSEWLVCIVGDHSMKPDVQVIHMPRTTYKGSQCKCQREIYSSLAQQVSFLPASSYLLFSWEGSRCLTIDSAHPTV